MIKVSGVVIYGKRKGRNLGFPTANIEVPKKLESGVYAGKTIISGRAYKSAVFVPKDINIIESYIFDFSSNIYGKKIEVEIGDKIREVIEFENNGKLVNQIKKDIELIKHM